MLGPKRGFSLLEVVISVILMAVIMAGMSGLFFGARRWMLHSRSRMQGAELSRRILDGLQMNIQQGQWAAQTNCLSSNGGVGCPPADTFENMTFTRTFTITDFPSTIQRQVKKVHVQIDWDQALF